jgi:hypothetical protein
MRFATLFAATALATAAHASIIPALDSVTPSGADFSYSYGGFLSGDTGLVAGDQLDIFNVLGYVPGSISAGANPNIVASAATGDPSGLALPPTFVLNPAATTLVFTYVGPDFDTSGGPFADLIFSGLSALSTIGTFADIGAYSATSTDNTGPTAGTEAFNFGSEAVPAPVPEPSGWALMLAGAGLAGTALRRRRPA